VPQHPAQWAIFAERSVLVKILQQNVELLRQPHLGFIGLKRMIA
jgi:hypothetical protein